MVKEFELVPQSTLQNQFICSRTAESGVGSYQVLAYSNELSVMIRYLVSYVFIPCPCVSLQFPSVFFPLCFPLCVSLHYLTSPLPSSPVPDPLVRVCVVGLCSPCQFILCDVSLKLPCVSFHVSCWYVLDF